MSLTKFTEDVTNIQSLPDKPTQTSTQLKTLFDKASSDIKTFINETLTTEVDSALALKANTANVYNKSQSDLYYVKKSDIAVVTVNSIPLDNSEVSVSYPTGFTKSNCVVISTPAFELTGNMGYEPTTRVRLATSNIYVAINRHVDQYSTTATFVLMKIS